MPRIARGEIEFALGYTEPEAGSDLSAIEIRADEDGENYVTVWPKTNAEKAPVLPYKGW